MTHTEFTRRYAAARRAAIELEFMHLNPEQRRAVLKTEGPLLILAGAGSGKTTVLINRVANILRYGRGSDSNEIPGGANEDDLRALEEYIKPPRADAREPRKSPPDELRSRVRKLCTLGAAEPWRVMAITFTNKAAGELKSRLEDMLGSGARDIWAMTFHSACVRILRRDIARLGYDPAFAIYDTADSQSVMKRVVADLNYDDKQFPPRSVLAYISRAKNDDMDAAEFSRDAEKGFDARRKAIARLYLEYERRCRAANALDFDDLLMTTARLLTSDADAREYYQRRFRYVHIDEYQDTNGLQYKLASLLAGGSRNICVVGDDDQSIYRFRGATIENILGFDKNYPDAEVARLEQNYRSTKLILSAANDVISRNKSRHDKTLWTEHRGGELPRLYTAEDERDEARFIAATIIDGAAGGKAFSDHAVLYRMNAQSNNFEYEFKRNNIPYKIYGGTGFFDRAEVKDAVAYLCAVYNPFDETRLLRIINTPARGIGGTTVDALTELSARTGIPVFELIRSNHEFPELQKASAKLSKFAELIEYLRRMSAARPLDEFYDTLLEATGLIAALEKKQSDENLTRIENIRELKTNIITFLRDNPEGTLAEYLGEIALYTDLDRDDGSEDCVALMTIHSSKGLEFDTVFIAGAEDGVFPGMRAIGEPEEMEEERRLCYVAMTRAKRRLFFVNARRRTLFGRTEAHRASCFVEEIASEHIDRPDERSAVDLWFDESPSTRGFARARTERNTRAVRTAPPPASPPQTAFKEGDRVKHRAFGRGVVVSVKPAGGDALLEVEFEDTGLRRLMQKSAASYMQIEK